MPSPSLPPPPMLRTLCAVALGALAALVLCGAADSPVEAAVSHPTSRPLAVPRLATAAWPASASHRPVAPQSRGPEPTIVAFAQSAAVHLNVAGYLCTAIASSVAFVIGLVASNVWQRRYRPVAAVGSYLAMAVTGEEDPCKELKKSIIEYPDQRSFVAIGLRDDTYAAAMAQAVSAVLRIDIDASTLLTRLSSNGKYLSVHIGPVLLLSEEQVVQVYTAIREDPRTKYCL
eukprot:EG_transcript_19396